MACHHRRQPRRPEGNSQKMPTGRNDRRQPTRPITKTMSKHRTSRRSSQGGTTPRTAAPQGPGVAQFSMSEVAQFSVSLDKGRRVGCAWGDPAAVGLASWRPGCCSIGPCWRLQRPEAHLPADRQLCPRPGAAEAGAHLPRQKRRWGGLQIAAVNLSGRGNPQWSSIEAPCPIPSTAWP